MTDYTTHEYADLFPMMGDDEFASLVEDVRRKGQIESIVLFKGQVLDGRNRYKACKQLGIEPRYKHFSGSDQQALEAVLSWNLERRHLSSSQKAAISVELVPLFDALEEQAKERQREAGGDRKSEEYQESVNQKFEKAVNLSHNERSTAHKAAAAMGTNRQYISDAKKLKDNAPEVHAAVKAGTLNISQAKEVARLPEIARESVIKQVEQAPQNKRFSTVKSAVQDAKKESPAAPFEFWHDSEVQRKTLVEKGHTVVANQKTDKNLIQWAENNRLYVRVDRYSDWGNPFLLPEDGNREEVCDWFEEYFGHKKSLQKRVTKEIKGKVLGCWCYPERCHADHLVREASK